jgi:hypothetical protein
MAKEDLKDMFVLQQDRVVATLKGHSIAFTKGKPVYVPKVVQPDVIAVGAVPADGSDFVLEEDKTKAPVLPEDREPAIRAAIAMLKERNERGDFTAAGQPDAKAVAELTGFKVQAKEISVIWQKLHDEAGQ